MKQIALLILLLACAANAQGAASTTRPPAALHAQPWAFGQSGARNDAIWKNGVDGDTIGKKAMPEKKPQAADTTAGVEEAVKRARTPAGKVGMTMNDETTAWKTTPEKIQPDEPMFRDRKHVVRAFADVKPSDDLSIRVGPELILKDENKGAEAASESQPDSALGVGMRFKYDF